MQLVLMMVRVPAVVVAMQLVLKWTEITALLRAITDSGAVCRRAGQQAQNGMTAESGSINLAHGKRTQKTTMSVI